MLLLIVDLLLVAAALFQAVLAFETRRGPEGPVGFHLVTGPIALAQVTALLLWLWLGPGLPLQQPAWPLWAALPGFAVAMTVLPVLGLERRTRWLARLAAPVVGLGTLLLANGPAMGLPPALPLAGAAVVGLAGAAAYLVAAASWVAHQRGRLAARLAGQARQSEWEREQGAWQLGEWRKLPADPAPWQLIQFASALHPEVRAECHQKLAALPDLDAQIAALLATGWADEALRYVWRHYPRSRAPLAPALAPVLDRAADEWAKTLAPLAEPQSYLGNVLKYLECAAAVQHDGGDLRPQFARWHGLLRGLRGYRDVARTVQKLARGERVARRSA